MTCFPDAGGEPVLNACASFQMPSSSFQNAKKSGPVGPMSFLPPASPLCPLPSGLKRKLAVFSVNMQDLSKSPLTACAGPPHPGPRQLSVEQSCGPCLFRGKFVGMFLTEWHWPPQVPFFTILSRCGGALPQPAASKRLRWRGTGQVLLS